MYLTAHPLDRFRPEIKSYCNISLYELNNNLQELRGREVCFAGIIKSFREGISQNKNRPFGLAMLEDYTDNYQLRLWGNDFVNYKKYFNPGVAIMVRALVEEWKSKKDGRTGIELRIKSIHMLSEVREEMVRTVQLIVPVDLVSDALIANLQKHLVQAEKGKNVKHLRFQIVDNETNLKIDLFSRNQFVDISDQFFEFIEENQELEYQLS